MSQSALVTGATGFIGGRLTRLLLSEGWRVAVLAREYSHTDGLPAEVTVHRIDEDADRLRDTVAAAAPDVVFHLASLYLADHQPGQVDALVESNILFVTRLAEAMTRAGVHRLVNTGTAWQHAAGDRPVNLYAATKRAAAEMLRYYQDARGLSVVTLTLFDSYGPGDTRRKLVQLLVEAALTGGPLGLSPGEQRIDLTHVDDIAAAFLVAAERLLGADRPLDERFFVGGDRLSVRELAASVGAALGRPVPAQFGERPYRWREVMEPATADPLLPGWTRHVALADGIRALAKAAK